MSDHSTTPARGPRPRPMRLILAAVLAIAAVTLPAGAGSAAPVTSGGWTTNATVTVSAPIQRGSTIAVSVTVTASAAATVLVDVEVADAVATVHQRFWDQQRFRVGRTRTYTTEWTVPPTARLEQHRVRVGVFSSGWGSLLHWNDRAATFGVVSGPPTGSTTTTTTAPTTTTTTTSPTTSTTTATTVPPAGRFGTLPVGAALPGDVECAARVRPAVEIRPQNATFNATTGAAPHPQNPRVTGEYSGTTDQILQWAACKWGIDEDLVRAQIARESWWHHDSRGDLTYNQSDCHPLLRTTSGPCPESYGLGQVRYRYHTPAMTDSIASAAYNVDYTYSFWRECFEGRLTWLNTVERGRQYAAGDAWGCIGVWFSGRWYTQPAIDYMGWVRDYLDDRIWETQPFIDFRG